MVSADFRVDDQVAIVTGAGGGIGEAIARVLAGAGARVVVADLDLDAAQKVAKAIDGDGSAAVAQCVDVTDAASVDQLVGATMAQFGKLDIYVNNAGIQQRRDALDITPDEFSRILAVDLNGVLYGSQAAARVMKAGSSIINILSFIVDRSTAGTASYGAAKSGAWALTRTFAIELGPRGIRVNGVAPGWTATALSRRRAVDEQGNFDEARWQDLLGRMSALSPLGSVAEPADSANAVLYLASPAARFLTGQVIRVNGGATMQ